jgi:hypothetical protein
MEHREVARCGFLVSRRETAVLFYTIEEALDLIALLVQPLVVPASNLSTASWRNDRQSPLRADEREDFVTVVALVGDDGSGLDVCQ